jgi:hypothetical protein
MMDRVRKQGKPSKGTLFRFVFVIYFQSIYAATREKKVQSENQKYVPTKSLLFSWRTSVLAVLWTTNLGGNSCSTKRVPRRDWSRHSAQRVELLEERIPAIPIPSTLVDHQDVLLVYIDDTVDEFWIVVVVRFLPNEHKDRSDRF